MKHPALIRSLIAAVCAVALLLGTVACNTDSPGTAGPMNTSGTTAGVGGGAHGQGTSASVGPRAAGPAGSQ